jgi:hypothetical protein
MFGLHIHKLKLGNWTASTNHVYIGITIRQMLSAAEIMCVTYARVYISVQLCVYIYIYWRLGGESFVKPPTGKSFRFVRACGRARRGEAVWASERRCDGEKLGLF